jgi:hypothetical protein
MEAYAMGGNLPDPERSKRTALWYVLALAVLSLVYCIAALVPGRFAVTDEVFFKAAGRNWAMTGRFAAPEITGRLSQGPPLSEIYFAQPPIYTFLFGALVKVAGFSPRSCIAYDTIIHLLLIWSAMLFARIVYGLDWSWAALSGALLVPLGTVGRPDELGIVFAMWSAIAFRSRLPDRIRAAMGGALLGLCVCTSLGAFLFLGPLVLWELFSARQKPAGRIADLGLAALVFVAVTAACVSPILIPHPAAYRQLIEHAGEQSAVLSAVTGEERNSSLGFVESWVTMMKYGFVYGFLIMGLFLFALLCPFLDSSVTHPAYSRIGILFFSLVLLAIAMPGKYPYLWFQGCWLLIACVALASHISNFRSWRQRALLVFGACVWLLASAPAVRWAYIMWKIPADESLTVSTPRLQAEVPAGVGVMTTDYWWALANRDKVYDLVFSDPGIGAIDYIVLSGNGSGRPGVPTDFKAKYKAGFVPIFDDLNRTPPQIAGHTLSRSSYGFGAYVLKKAPGALP